MDNAIPGFDWLSGHCISSSIPYQRNSDHELFLVILAKRTQQDLTIFLRCFNKTIIPLAIVGYEMITQLSATNLLDIYLHHIQGALMEELLTIDRATHNSILSVNFPPIQMWLH